MHASCILPHASHWHPRCLLGCEASRLHACRCPGTRLHSRVHATQVAASPTRELHAVLRALRERVYPQQVA